MSKDIIFIACWLIGAFYTISKMYQLFVDPYIGDIPDPIKLLTNVGRIIIIPIICCFAWPLLLITYLYFKNKKI